MRMVAESPTEGVIGFHCIVAPAVVKVNAPHEPDLRNSLELQRNATLLG